SVGWGQLQSLTNVHYAQAFHRGIVDDRGGRRRGEIAGALDARSRHRDFLESRHGCAGLRGTLIGWFRRALWGLLRLCGGAETQHQRRGPDGARQVFRQSRLGIRYGRPDGGIYRGTTHGHLGPPPLRTINKQAKVLRPGYGGTRQPVWLPSMRKSAG